MVEPELLEISSALSAKYRIEGVLGRGGMGLVVAARHVSRQQRVALKIVLPETRDRQHASARLLREARAAAVIGGQRIPRVLEVDRLADGTYIIVMERLVGRTLRSLLDEEGSLSYATVAEYGSQICEALVLVHAARIVHRDVKPANLYVEQTEDRRSLRLLDFGACKFLDAPADGTDERGEGFVGSTPYVSPEQLAGLASVDFSSDLWSLGVVLYECLVGRRPFRGDSFAALAQSIMLEPVPRLPRELGVPLAFERVLRRCLAKDPLARYSDARALACDLNRARAEPHCSASGWRSGAASRKAARAAQASSIANSFGYRDKSHLKRRALNSCGIK